MHSITPYSPPALDESALRVMRAPPSPTLLPSLDSHDSSGNEGDGMELEKALVGAFPGAETPYTRADGASTYY
jgi:hypothetical protein